MKRRTLLRTLSAGTIAMPGIIGPASAAGAGGYIDAGEMGLLSQGGGDQTSVLQQIIRGAMETGRPLFIPGGNYFVAGIVLPSNVTIIGQSGATVLTSATGEPVFISSWQSNISLQSLIFDGMNTGTRNADTGLLALEECAAIDVEGCRFQNYKDNGFYLRNCAGRVTGNVFNDLGQSAIHAQNSAGLLISNNTINSCANGGIRVWRHKNGSDQTIVTNNRIAKIGSEWGDGQNGNGINIFQADEVVVANNVISDCALSAIRANSTNNTIIEGNQCLNSSEVAIFSEFAFSGSIISNNLVDGAATGISITNFDDGGRLAICSNNIVRNIMPFSPTNPDTVPIGIFAEADTAINANIVENVPGVGIRVGWGTYLRNVLVSDNIVRLVKYGIAVSIVEGVGHAKISDNMIVEASDGGIVGMRWEEIASIDLVRDQNNFPRMSLSDNSFT